jgi:hypothetical protein
LGLETEPAAAGLGAVLIGFDDLLRFESRHRRPLYVVGFVVGAGPRGDALVRGGHRMAKQCDDLRGMSEWPRPKPPNWSSQRRNSSHLSDSAIFALGDRGSVIAMYLTHGGLIDLFALLLLS